MKTKLRRKIGVLMGGASSEREVSLQSGRAVYEALKKGGWNVAALDIVSEKLAANQIKKAEIDVAFIALHGRFGEDGRVQALLEFLAIPYTGSGIRASRLAMDKIASREVLSSSGITVPRYTALKGIRGCQELSKMTFPLVIKPSSHGSSIGLSIIEDKKDLSPAIDKAGKYDNTIIIEEYIAGKEITVGILDQQPLPLIWLIPGNRFYDYQAKYQKGKTLHIIPALLDEDVYLKAQAAALQAHQVLNCQGFSRVDMIIDNNSNPVVLEVNTIPGFTSTSLLPLAAGAEGYGLGELCGKLVKMALVYEKKKKKK
ncbi:MAG: D-alanine--D-alanine ligase [Candidatus Omnitrophota bacterium]|nr:D-alanine--D-alanine ligase [Candidatus Omnitrophota bacterium]